MEGEDQKAAGGEIGSSSSSSSSSSRNSLGPVGTEDSSVTYRCLASSSSHRASHVSFRWAGEKTTRGEVGCVGGWRNYDARYRMYDWCGIKQLAIDNNRIVVSLLYNNAHSVTSFTLFPSHRDSKCDRIKRRPPPPYRYYNTTTTTIIIIGGLR